VNCSSEQPGRRFSGRGRLDRSVVRQLRGHADERARTDDYFRLGVFVVSVHFESSFEFDVVGVHRAVVERTVGADVQRDPVEPVRAARLEPQREVLVVFAAGVAVLVTAGGYAGLSVVPVTLPVLPLVLLLGAAVFLGLISHLFADALTVGRNSHAIRPFNPLSPHPLRFGLVGADSRLANSFLLTAGGLLQAMAFVVSIGGATGVVV
jgi:hypothetical protein